MPHSLRIKSESGTENEYRITVVGGIEAAAGIGGRDHVTNDGRTAVGRVVGGVDEWDYWGAKETIEATDPNDLLLSVNNKPWQPATAFGATRMGGVRGGDGGSGTETDRAGGTNPENDATPAYQGTPDGILSSTREYREFFERPIPNSEEKRVGVRPGAYHPPAIQRTILHSRPEYSIQALGTQDPYQTDISRANHNFTLLCKDEHFWVEGMLWGRTQFSGCADPYCRNMAFTDRYGKGQSAIGGKSATGRYIGCDIGHKDDPDEYAAYYYGGGRAHFDRDNTFRATGDAYIGVNNTVTLYFGGDNEFASGHKEVVEGSGIYPDDLSNDMDIIECGTLR